MKLIAEIRLRARHVIGPVMGALLIIYVAYHAVQGERGLIAYRQLYQQVGQAKTFHAALLESRKQIQQRVNLLNPASLDRDMLDERVRFMLGYSHPKEIIIFTR